MAKSDSDEPLEKIYVDLPGHWQYEGEAMWAKPLGDDLFELRNVPFGAYGLNFGDVVRARSSSPELKPQVEAVVKASGHRTLRLTFNAMPEQQQLAYLKQLERLGAEPERAVGGFIALDIPPDVAYDQVFKQLDALEKLGVLDFETCDTRVPGTFTSEPEEKG